MISYDSPTYKTWEGRPEIACPPVPLSPHLLCRVIARGRHGVGRSKQRHLKSMTTTWNAQNNSVVSKAHYRGIYTVRNLNRFNSSIESIQVLNTYI